METWSSWARMPWARAKQFLEGIPGVTQKLFFLFEMAVTDFSPDYVAQD